MKVCEVCGGLGHRSKRMCTACWGTGLILLGPEGGARYAELMDAARARGEREGWTEEVWQLIEPPAFGRKVRIPVRVEQPTAKDVA